MLAGWLVVSPSSSCTGSNVGVSHNALCTRVFHTGWAKNLLVCSSGRTFHVRFTVKLDARRLGVRLARAEILEQVLPLWSIHGAPLSILHLLPCNVK